MIPTDQDLAAFVIRESRLIDEQRLDEWLDLFAADGRYWVPLERDQPEGPMHASFLDEDVLLLKIRIERLHRARTFSQSPRSHCHHLLQAPSVESRNEVLGIYDTYTPLHYVETRRDDQILLAAWARHTLCVVDGALKIRRKRVDLVNCDAAFGNIQLFL